MTQRALAGERLLGLYVGLILAFLALPILVVIPSAFSAGSTLAFPPQGFSLRWFANILARPELVRAAGISAAVAGVATAVSLVAGLGVTLALGRYRFPGREALRMLFLTPLVFPAIVLAVAVAMVLSPLGLVRSFWGLVLAHVVITLPYIIRTTSATLAEIDRACEEAALTLGANPWRSFRHVTLPLLRPGILAGVTFSFIISFDEFTISLFLVGPGMMTLPLEMYNYAEFSLDPTLAALSTVLIGMTVVAVLLIERFVGLGRHFT
ncbi:ABC transporter permease [Roseomonas sp. E05]|uniref:ABC transporter permease n=1 Tax=Roseomonas sp. E05 TaxID=3046310 RepID=UPI0024BAF0CA|nr:ABC transporter permease [Roseomonas sp. E05]MDJ0388769.1 ABC transporter permease [Roseomonas sp. E05]